MRKEKALHKGALLAAVEPMGMDQRCQCRKM